MIEPKTSIAKISQVVQEAIDRHGWMFTMQNENLSSEEVAAANGFLPLLLENASFNASEALGANWKFESKYAYEQKALCQMIPAVESVAHCPISALVLFIDHALEEKVAAAKKLLPSSKQHEEYSVPLDDWMEKFIERYKLGYVQLEMPTAPSPSTQA